MKPYATLAAALLLAAPFTTTSAAVTPAPVAAVTPVGQAASRPASGGGRAVPARPGALPVGAETLPADWLEAVEPGLSKSVRGAPPPAAPTRPAPR